MTMNLLRLVIMLSSSLFHLTLSIHCTSITSSISSVSSGANTQGLSCPIATYTLVSCGFKSDDSVENNVKGSYINPADGLCYARNSVSSTGVYAIARCCDLTTYSISCQTYQSQPNDNIIAHSKTSVQCSPTQSLLGCTSRTKSNRHNGNYPKTGDPIWSSAILSEPDACAAWSYEDGISYSFATCCSSNNGAMFQCESIWSGESTDQYAIVSCPNTDQFMSSCSGSSERRSVNQWEIDNNNQCIVRNALPGTIKIIAIAICCSISNPTLNPTSTPTSNPTSKPTSITIPPTPSTSSPTVSTITPTKMPTPIPTINPMPAPTISSTPTKISSTTYPTELPTRIPTEDPTQNPTEPTPNPTDPPTPNPTYPPTSIDTTPIPATSMLTTSKPTDTPSATPSVNYISPTHTTYSPSKRPTNNPTVNTINQFAESSEAANIQQSDFWKDDPYAYAVYVAIIFVVILVIAMAVCSYCKFKPSKQDKTKEGEQDMDDENKQNLTTPPSEHTAAITQPNITRITSDEDEEVLSNGFGGKPTAGGPDERYIVEMVLKQEQKKKMKIDLKERGLNELAVNDEYYAQNIYNAQQQDTMLMDNIVDQMKDSYDNKQD